MMYFINKWVICFVYLFIVYSETQFVFPEDPISLPSYSVNLPTSQTQNNMNNNKSCNSNFVQFAYTYR